MLTDEMIIATLPGEKQVKLSDGGGLYLLVHPRGSKLWRFRYQFQGKEKMLSFGVYPGVGIDDARAMRKDAKRLLINGLDPSEERKMGKMSEKQKAGGMSVRIRNDGVLEVWKGRIVLMLDPDEAAFVKDQLCRLVV